jgi:hypothetical protein
MNTKNTKHAEPAHMMGEGEEGGRLTANHAIYATETGDGS